MISRAAVLGSLLPQWNSDWPKHLLEKFPTEKSYHEWFLQLIGIFGDPVSARKLIDWAKDKGVKLQADPYGYKRAFTRNPSPEDAAIVKELLGHTWGKNSLSVIDPMAGGGSIPFESLRFGFETYANELNPVASVILRATLEYPSRFGAQLSEDIKKWGNIFCQRVNEKLAKYFPKQPNESIHAYIWARTVSCPVTGKPVPLSPNWWLQKGSNPVAARLVADPDREVCQFRIEEGKAAIALSPDKGTVKQGIGRSPWTGDPIDGDYIKAEAQAGRMGQQLYAVGTKTEGGLKFRAPINEDLMAVDEAEKELLMRMPEWKKANLVPMEERYAGPADRSINYGIVRWFECFSPRQLLSMIVAVEELKNLGIEIEHECGQEKAKAIRTYLALAIDKSADYNSRRSRFHSGRGVMVNSFERHDFAFKWSHGEFDAADNLYPWVVGQIIDAFEGISRLVETKTLFHKRDLRGSLSVTKGNANDLNNIETGSVNAVCVDPPYSANVMYAECSDFFYVWQKRTVGELFPNWFRDDLTNKDDEAVANQARFEGARNKKALADTDYERKMASCFREMHRILHPDGVLTVMFTHKEVEAWNNLAVSLISAGFSIQTSWPVHTESEHSLHQVKKNSASSTILLVCRKRLERAEPTWWDDIKGAIRQTARNKAHEFHALGISGVDLYISTFGPVLSVLSQNWPVLSSETDSKGEPMVIRPEVALDLAREEVVALRKQELLLGRTVQFDQATDWYLMAWDAFNAEEFPADEARKLAIVLGLDIEREVIAEKRIATKKGKNVIIQQPLARRKKGVVDEELNSFGSWLDAAHTAMLIYQEDGGLACQAFLKRTGLMQDQTFKAVLQAMINAIPRTKNKDNGFVRPESKTLDDLRLSFFDDLSVPIEEEPKVVATQGTLTGFVEDETAEEEEEELEE